MQLLLLLLLGPVPSQQVSSLAPTTSATATTAATSASWEPVCPPSYTGHVPSPNCTSYIVCSSGSVSSPLLACASGTLFNVELGSCDWETNVVCTDGTGDDDTATAETDIVGAAEEDGTASPSQPSTPAISIPNTNSPTYAPTQTRPPSSNAAVEDALFYAAHDMDTKLFVVKTDGGGGGGESEGNDGVEEGWRQSKLYRFHGFIAGLRMAYTEGVAGMTFYLGDDDAGADDEESTVVGLVNIAAFLAQSMKETIKYDACDENDWDIINGKYPLSNACGQLGQSYQDYDCPDEYLHMQCQVDPNMEIVATTQASWYGAPGPLFCGPTSKYPTTGFWDYTYLCDYSWRIHRGTVETMLGRREDGMIIPRL